MPFDSYVAAAAPTIFTAPRSDQSNVTGGTDFAPAVTTVWPLCASSGWGLLGDLRKCALHVMCWPPATRQQEKRKSS